MRTQLYKHTNDDLPVYCNGFMIHSDIRNQMIIITSWAQAQTSHCIDDKVEKLKVKKNNKLTIISLFVFRIARLIIEQPLTSFTFIVCIFSIFVERSQMIFDALFTFLGCISFITSRVRTNSIFHFLCETIAVAV